MQIRGVTAEERRAARRARTAGNRVAFFRQRLLAAAGKPSEQLRHTRDYLGAIGDDLPPEKLADFVRALAQLADEWAAK